MSSQFKKGDLVIGQNFTYSGWRNGQEGEIIAVGPIMSVRADNGQDSVADYLVAWTDGTATSCNKTKLRKRRPPEQPADADFQEWLKGIIKPSLEQTMNRVQKNLSEYVGDSNGS